MVFLPKPKPDHPVLTYDGARKVFGLSGMKVPHLTGWSNPQATGATGYFMTRNPYRAYNYVAYADAKAAEVLQEIYEGVQESSASGLDYVDPADRRLFDAIPAGETLYAYQLAGVAAIVKRKSAYLADEPGLGKTPQAICAINYLRPEKTIIIVPASLILNWEAELERWLVAPLSVGVYIPGRTHLHQIMDKNIVIISYNNITSRVDSFIRHGFLDMIICDEAHYLKSADSSMGRTPSARAKSLMGDPTALLKMADRVLLLSGTPSPNRLSELLPFIRHLRPDLMCGVPYKAYRDWMFSKDVELENGGTRWGKLYPDCELEYKTSIFADWLIRREKKDVLTQLPPKRYHLAVLDGGTAFKPLIKMSEDLNIADVTNIPSSKISAVAEVRHALGVAKAPLVAKYVKDMLDDGTEKIVVFAHHKRVVDILVKDLAEYRPVLIIGGMTATAKHASVKTFQNDPGCRVIICNITSGGVGLTLTAAHDVVFAEASYVPGENEQAIDRLHRITQKERVVAYFPSVPGTIDFNVLKAFLTKKEELKFYNSTGKNRAKTRDANIVPKKNSTVSMPAL